MFGTLVAYRYATLYYNVKISPGLELPNVRLLLKPLSVGLKNGVLFHVYNQLRINVLNLVKVVKISLKS